MDRHSILSSGSTYDYNFLSVSRSRVYPEYSGWFFQNLVTTDPPQIYWQSPLLGILYFISCKALQAILSHWSHYLGTLLGIGGLIDPQSQVSQAIATTGLVREWPRIFLDELFRRLVLPKQT